MDIPEEKKEDDLNTDKWQEYQDNPSLELRNELVLLYTDLVKRIVLRFKGSYNNFGQMDDMINQGMIVLIDAVEKFEPSRGYKFATFASLKIRGAIIDFMRKQDWVPRSHRSLSRVLEQTYGQLYAELGREPTNKEIADVMEITEDNLLKILHQRHNAIILSYEETVGEKMMDSEPLLHEGSQEDSPEARLLGDELKDELAKAIDSLKENERLVVSLYYYENLKLREIGEILGVSESRVSQIHSQVMIKLRDRLKRY